MLRSLNKKTLPSTIAALVDTACPSYKTLALAGPVNTIPRRRRSRRRPVLATAGTIRSSWF